MVYVRPLIEFAVPVRRQTQKVDIKKLLYSERLEILGLTTLEERQTRDDLIQITYKILNGIEEVDLCVKPIFREEAMTRGHNLRYSRVL